MKFRAPHILAALLAGSAVVTMIFWYQVTFSRRLDDAALLDALRPEATVRQVQHGFEEVTHRFEAGAPGMDRWAGLVVEASRREETPVRRAAAWSMQYAAARPDFAARLREMMGSDRDETVRRMAACALSKAGDASARPTLRSMLENYTITSPVAGKVDSILPAGRRAELDGLVAKIQRADGTRVEAPGTVPGRILEVKVAEGAEVVAGSPLVVVAPDPEHALNAVVALALVGTPEDLPLIQSLAGAQPAAGARVAEQVPAVVAAIQARAKR